MEFLYVSSFITSYGAKCTKQRTFDNIKILKLPKLRTKTSDSKVNYFLSLQIDLYYIKKEFLSLYSRQLHDEIDKQCSYEYAKLLKVILEMRGQYSESAKKR